MATPPWLVRGVASLWRVRCPPRSTTVKRADVGLTRNPHRAICFAEQQNVERPIVNLVEEVGDFHCRQVSNVEAAERQRTVNGLYVTLTNSPSRYDQLIVFTQYTQLTASVVQRGHVVLSMYVMGRWARWPARRLERNGSH